MSLSAFARRLGMGVLTVFGVSVVIFLLSVLPGDPLAGFCLRTRSRTIARCWPNSSA